jgi:hypothetical protein
VDGIKRVRESSVSTISTYGQGRCHRGSSSVARHLLTPSMATIERRSHDVRIP